MLSPFLDIHDGNSRVPERTASELDRLLGLRSAEDFTSVSLCSGCRAGLISTPTSPRDDVRPVLMKCFAAADAALLSKAAVENPKRMRSFGQQATAAKRSTRHLITAPRPAAAGGSGGGSAHVCVTLDTVAAWPSEEAAPSSALLALLATMCLHLCCGLMTRRFGRPQPGKRIIGEDGCACPGHPDRNNPLICLVSISAVDAVAWLNVKSSHSTEANAFNFNEGRKGRMFSAVDRFAPFLFLPIGAGQATGESHFRNHLSNKQQPTRTQTTSRK